MKHTLITNQKINNDNYVVKTFTQFIDETTSDEGLHYDGDFFYVDVASVNDEQIYEEIAGAGLKIKWILLEGEVPEWFSLEIEETPKNLNQDELQDEDVSVLSQAIAFLDKEPETEAYNQNKKIGSIITFGSAKGGSGKSTTTSTLILAEHGWVRAGDIQVGDKIWTPKGTLSKVIKVYPQGILPIFDFETTAGQKVQCSAEHLWTVTNFAETKWQTMTTQDLLDKGLENGSGRSHYYKWAIPVSKAIPFEEKALPVDPYVLGAMIGDGCCTLPALTISSNDEFVVKKMAKKVNAHHYRSIPSSYDWNFYVNEGNERIQTKTVLNNVPEILHRAGGKHIPEIYKFSSLEQRWELIQGLFDTDGHITLRKDRKAALNYSTTSKDLAYDIREILYSLGIESRIKTFDRRGKIHSSAGKEYIRKSVEYEVIVCCPVELYPKFFTLPRRLERAEKAVLEYNPQSSVRKYDRVNIKSITPAGSDECVCILIEDKDHLYITKDYIVTHNTFTSLITAYYYAKEHPENKVAFLDLDITEPQISAVLKNLHKSIKPYYLSYTQGNSDFSELEKCKYNHKGMPENLDFYLSQKEQHAINDTRFWETLMTRLFYNYDMVFLDTGTEYLNIDAIITAYKVADRINIVCMPNMASSVIVSRQIKYLTGEKENAVYSAEDGLEDKLSLVFTNYYDNNITNAIVEGMGDKCPIAARFGNLTPHIDEIEVLNKWNHFDDNEAFRQGIKALYGEV